MKNKLLLLLLISIAGCAANHEHDGLYIANKTTTGVIKVWILDGNNMMIYSMGAQQTIPCKQFNDRIEVKGDASYSFENDSTISISKDSGTDGLKMLRISRNTKFNFGELDKLIEKRSTEGIMFRR